VNSRMMNVLIAGTNASGTLASVSVQGVFELPLLRERGDWVWPEFNETSDGRYELEEEDAEATL